MAKSTSTAASAPKVRPLFNNVLVKPLESETVTSGGIFIPDIAVQEKPAMGVVMEIGDVVTVKVGDKVVYKKWQGNDFKVGSQEWTIVEEKDILAVVS